MAAAIPVIAAFASAGAAVATAGGIAAALGTVTGFLAIGGAALTAVGAITKNSNLTKIGGFMGLAGGVGTALGMGGAAAGASAAQEAANSAWSAGGAAEVAGGAGASALEAGAKTAGAALPEGLEVASQEAANQSANKLALANATTEAGPGLQTEPSLMSRATDVRSVGVVDPNVATNPLQQRAAGLTSEDVIAGMKAGASKVGSALGQVGQFMRDNKELVTMGGSALASMYGPEAERANLLKSQDEFNRSIYNRRMANLNSPVSLYKGP